MVNRKVNKLLVVSHVRHYYYHGDLYAYAPYVEELDVWAGLFAKVLIASPCYFSLPSPDTKKINSHNVSIIPIVETGGNNIYHKIKQIILTPFISIKLAVSMKSVDAVHVRCPGNLGLLGVLLAPLFSSYRVAKYAGQWNDYPEEAWSYRLQRYILKSRWWNAPVTVYGEWPHQPKHIVPFFTSLLNDKQIDRARLSAVVKRMHQPLRILFVGRLVHQKNVHVLLGALRSLKEYEINFDCRIIGDGPMRDSLEEYAVFNNLNVTLTGALPFENVLENYEWGDVLVLASETEGWPKAITEAMAFGLVCIGSNRGLVPQMLADGRGCLVMPGDEVALASALKEIALEHIDFMDMSKKAAIWSQYYSLDGLQKAIRDLLMREWHLQDEDLRKIS